MLRRRILIAGFQYRLLVANLVYFLTICFAFVCVVFAPMVMELGATPSLSPEKEQAADAFQYLSSLLWPGALVLCTLLGFHSVVISQRVAGPLCRFRKAFEAGKAGNLSRVRIRKNDYLEKEVDSINEMFQSWSARVAEMREHCADVAALVPKLREAASGADRGGIDESLDSLEATVEALRSSVGWFKVEPERRESSPRENPGVQTGTKTEVVAS